MADDYTATLRIRQPAKDDRARTIWADEIETAELELVSKAGEARPGRRFAPCNSG